ncbi:MAG TPA: hypothetical protein VGN15_13170 [Ktedonobacteraceae bacterium]|nr:hypothetical protein [Ktedonobacteraceae bacterium]
MTSIIFPVTIGVTIFLCLLNMAFAFVFRKRGRGEVLSYIVVGIIELAVFCLVLILHLGKLHSIPLRLPAHLPVTRSEIGAALAIGIGLFPAAYWHRTSAAQIRAKMAADAKIIKEQDGGVRVRNHVPGEWLN